MTAVVTQAERVKKVAIRPLREDELPMADSIMRVAFGTFLGLPEPSAFMGTANFIRHRWQTNPDAAFAAEVDGELAGTNFGSRWGSVGLVGPLSVRPEFWNLGIGRRLMEPVMERFPIWGARMAGLFTFPHSPKHLGLYQKFGFWPRYLTALLSKPVTEPGEGIEVHTYSELAEPERIACLDECRAITGAAFEGLDLSREVQAIDALGLGDTVLVRDDGGVAAFAACHTGPETEAGAGACYVKFAAVRPGQNAPHQFERLLAACQAFAAARGASTIQAGVNTARTEAYAALLARGYRTEFLGIAMHAPNLPAFSRAGVYVLDDWR